MVDINLKGSFIVAKHVIPTMLEQGSGSITHIASVEGLVGISGQLAYNASKGGVVLMTKNMALDYSPAGIRVNCICPGGVETPMTEMLKMEALRRPSVRSSAQSTCSGASPSPRRSRRRRSSSHRTTRPS